MNIYEYMNIKWKYEIIYFELIIVVCMCMFLGWIQAPSRYTILKDLSGNIRAYWNRYFQRFIMDSSFPKWAYFPLKKQDADNYKFKQHTSHGTKKRKKLSLKVIE